MPENIEMKVIGHIYTDFPTKFGLPRQSGLAGSLLGKIIMETEFRKAEAFRGIEEYSHLWLLWQFSESKKDNWSATVKPPRLGGKVRMGVFATRSPYRPNPIGMSAVKLETVEYEEANGPILIVSGIDMMDGTPILDIKPYLPYADAHTDARGGFGDRVKGHALEVTFEQKFLELLPKEKRAGAIEFLKQDPRPPYHNHPEQIYKISYAGFDLHFQVKEDRLEVMNIEKL